MIIIGEKINGSVPAVAAAIREKDANYIHDLAIMQSAGRADYIDVCSAVMDDDVAVLHWLIDRVQEVSESKISIDSPDVHSIERAMKFCNKPGLINSVSMEGDKIDTIFPVIADTEWQVIALLCDDRKIPDSVDERMEIFERIMEKAKEYRIAPSRIHIDPMVFSLGTKPDAFTNFAAVTRSIKEKCPDVHVTSGLSNISYGLPSRKTINQSFLVLAIAAGMDSAIIDPTNDMLGAIYSARALLEIDEYCIEYLAAYGENLFGVKKKS